MRAPGGNRRRSMADRSVERSSEEELMPDITNEVSSWLDRMLGVIGASGGAQAQEAAPGGGGAPPPCESVPPYREESPLAAEIRAALAAGGINIAIYMIG